MKVTHLLEGSELSYDSDLKRVFGDTKDWLEKAGIAQHDIISALVQIKNLHEFKRIAEKVPYTSSPRQEMNGTLEFRTDEWIGYITAMGQIRFTAINRSKRYQGHNGSPYLSFSRLASPKPGLVHGNPVASLVKTMKAALIEFAKKPRVLRELNRSAVSENMEPKSEGWYLKQLMGDKSSKWVAGPMSEEQADKAVEQRGGSKRGISKSFVTRLALQKKKEAALV